MMLLSVIMFFVSLRNAVVFLANYFNNLEFF